MNRHPQPLLGQLQRFGQKLPCKLNRLALEIIAKTEVAEHLEKSMVTRGVPDILQVIVFATRAHAFLCGNRALIGALLQTQKRLLELVHPGIGKQQRRIIRGDQRT